MICWLCCSEGDTSTMVSKICVPQGAPFHSWLCVPTHGPKWNDVDIWPFLGACSSHQPFALPWGICRILHPVPSSPTLCPAPFLSLVKDWLQFSRNYFSNGLASSRISVPASEGEGFLQRQLVSTREGRTITYFRLQKLGQSGTHCLPEPFYFSVTARTWQSIYSVLLHSQQGSGMQSSCNFIAPELGCACKFIQAL